ncbi:hypothetical protein LWI28_021638 [Acer negundo]|uniref:Uncharacterized protein n=1 Tax=Acer negundo TaxID=4023 RepID=A0AAD5IVJ5_ACENE|nr:hypothetical protein LWI28_021638 [Acer negundo]
MGLKTYKRKKNITKVSQIPPRPVGGPFVFEVVVATRATQKKAKKKAAKQRALAADPIHGADSGSVQFQTFKTGSDTIFEGSVLVPVSVLKVWFRSGFDGYDGYDGYDGLSLAIPTVLFQFRFQSDFRRFNFGSTSDNFVGSDGLVPVPVPTIL